jgi:TP901 family phage tail tape measure protein
MAGSATYLLNLILNFRDNMRGGINKDIALLRQFDSQVKKSLSLVRQLEKATGKQRGTGISRTSSLTPQHQELRLMRDRTRLMQDEARLGIINQRARKDSMLAGYRSAREEIRLRRDSVGLLRDTSRHSYSGEMQELKLLREKMRLRQQSINLVNQERDALQRSMLGGAAISGAGLGLLAGVRSGMRDAGDFEASITDLRTSVTRLGSDGRVNLAQLGGEMAKLESLAIRLGNQLPGTTSDFVSGMIAAKQGGLQAQEIIDGAGEAVAHLAVVMRAAPRDIGTPFAKFGQQYGLRGQEYVQLADVMARTRGATGANPMDLIEASKYFAPRAAAPLGITGLGGATETTQLLGLLNRRGIVSEQAGTNLSTFFSRLTMQKRPQQQTLAELKKQGINLDFFDKQGKFAGVENAFTQLEKLRGLSDEKRLGYTTRLFGQEGAGVANVFTETGGKGYADFKKELASILPLQQQITAETATFNAKWESTVGTLQNIKVAAFTPMLDALKPALDLSNKVAGGVANFTKEHPGMARIGVDFITIAGGTLAVTGGVRTMTTAWRLWKITSAFSRGESLVPYLNNTSRAADAAGNSIGAATTKAGRFKNAIGNIPTAVKIGFTLMALDYTTQKVLDLMEANKDLGVANKGADSASNDAYRANLKYRDHLKRLGRPYPEKDTQFDTSLAISSLNRNNEFINALDPSRQGGWERLLTMGTNPYSSASGRRTGFFGTTHGGSQEQNEAIAANELRRRAPMVHEPDVMRGIRQWLDKQGLNQEARASADRVLKNASSTTYERVTGPGLDWIKSIQSIGKGGQGAGAQPIADQFNVLLKPTADVTTGFTNLVTPLSPLPGQFMNAGNAAESFADKLYNLDLNVPSVTYGAPSSPAAKYLGFGGGKAHGGRVVKDVTYIGGERGPELFTPGRSGYVIPNHKLGENISPARVTSQWRDELPRPIALHHNLSSLPVMRRASLRMPEVLAGGDSHVHININVPPGSQAAADPEELARIVKAELRQEIAELHRQLRSVRRHDRVGDRVLGLGEERA